MPNHSFLRRLFLVLVLVSLVLSGSVQSQDPGSGNGPSDAENAATAQVKMKQWITPTDRQAAPASDAIGFAQEAPGWEQVNSDGFGDPQTVEISALEAFNGRLYAGTTNPIAGARIFRSQDGATWTPVTQPGFGIPHDTASPSILDLAVFNGRLYASTGLGDGPGQIWRTLDGVNWAPMVIAGFSDPDTVNITALAAYNGALYAGATNLISGAQIWRSFTGDSNTWTQMVAPAAPGTDASSITGFAVFDGALYAAVESDAPAQIWRSYGGAWTAVMSNGFGNSLTTSAGGMAEFAGYLYVGAGNSAVGAQLWRTNDGAGWEQAIDPALGDSNNSKVEIVFVFQNHLYISARNAQTGMELWRSTDGALWQQVNRDGFGDSNNSGSNRSNAAAAFLSRPYVGTSNVVDGGEMWRMQYWHTYLPLVLR